MLLFSFFFSRVIPPNDEKTIGRYQFKGWGSHYSNYPCSYLTAAAAIGATRQDIDLFLKRLEKNFKDFMKDPSTNKRNNAVEETNVLKSDNSAPVKLLETSFPHIDVSGISTMRKGNSDISSSFKTPLRPSNSCEGGSNSTWPKQQKEYSVDDNEIQRRKNLSPLTVADLTTREGQRKSNSSPSVNKLARSAEDERHKSQTSKEGGKMSFLIDL